MAPEVIKALPFQKEILSPEKFLDLTKQERDNILSSRPVIFSKYDPGFEFGGIEVIWRDPVYRANL